MKKIATTQKIKFLTNYYLFISFSRKFVLKLRRLGIILTLVLLFSVNHMAVVEEPYVLFYPRVGDDKKAINLSVPPHGEVLLTLAGTNTEGLPGTFDLSLTPFVGEHGDRIIVNLRISDELKRKIGPNQKDIKVKRPLLFLSLEVPPLKTPDKYSGMLFLIVDNNIKERWTLALSRTSISLPAALVLDRQAISFSLSRPVFPWWVKDHIAEFTVHLREKTNEWPIKHVFVRLEEVQGPDGQFDPKKKFEFKFKGKRIDDFWSLSPKDQKEIDLRSINQGGQAAVLFQLRDLDAGEYMTKLRFQASNSKEDEDQELTLAIKVRDSVWWAIGILFIAVVFSYIATKGLKTLRQHLDFRKRISELRPAWLRTEPSILPVVWIRAMLRQAEDRSKRWLLSASDVIETRITQASQLLKPLDRIRRFREALKHLGAHPMVMRRAEKAQRRVVMSMGAGPIDDKLLGQIETDLIDLEGWLKSDQQLREHYWNNLKIDISRLLDIVRLTEIPDFAQEQFKLLIKDLEDSLKSGFAPNNIKNAVEHENKYARLKILWERRYDDEELKKLISLQESNEMIDKLFETTDKAVWKCLKEATEKTGIRFVSPRKESPEPFEAYQPLFFEVAPGDPSLGDNYLFKHGLIYKWLFELELRQSWLSRLIKGKKKPIPLNPISNVPRVVQYAPRPGVLKASVEIYFEGEPEEPPLPYSMENLEIARSRDFRWQRAFGAVEIGASILALIVAILTGLSIKYFSNSTFGSGGDYLTLFLWGAGADQTKNFIQILQSYSAQPKESSGGK